MNKTLSKTVLAIVFSIASLSASAATYSFTVLNGLAGGYYSYAYSINNLGQIVGVSQDANGNLHSTLWNNEVATDINPQDSIYSVANSINELGQIVGVSQNTTDINPRATLWNNGMAANIDPQDSIRSSAKSINDLGQIVGFSQAANSATGATLWNNGVVTDINPQDSVDGYANSINNLGQIVGTSLTPVNFRAILWNNGVATYLNPLDSINNEAFSINNLGQIVGISQTVNGYSRATLWNNGVETDLNSFLSASEKSEGWVLQFAYDINDSGSIVGTAFNTVTYASRGFLLQSVAAVPEADTSAMLLMGSGVMGFMTRRRKNNQA